MAVSKVILNGTILMDVTDDTVDANSLLSGITATAANGVEITGTYVPPTPSLQSKSATYTPTTSQQTATITADSGYDGLSSVGITVNAMPSGTAGTPTATKGTVSNHAVSVTPSVTNTTGYITGGTKTGTAVSVSASELVSGTYSVTSSGTKDVTNYASISVPSGTAGTPSATKGTVSNHSVTVTPSVTNTTGLIAGSTKTGTAVTVTASELVSGTLSITENGTVNVTNYASVNVNVSSGGGNYTATAPDGGAVYLVAWDDVNEMINNVYTADYPSGVIVTIYMSDVYEVSIYGNTTSTSYQADLIGEYNYAFRMPNEDVTIYYN